ncbi:MAG: TonB-dependent receptor, partial [Pseudomonadota bacterium]|nr:TonB-dependent receptor [Pseudomonadota bacterium]
MAAGVLLALLALPATAQDTSQPKSDSPATDAVQLDRVTVVGRRQNLVGETISASEGSVGQAEIAARPFLRSGDLLEFVPGLVATQHSGSGKANQYFLRGFNLDHGTDFATFVDGMPVNMRTHGHGQGYTDLNFLIPEAVGELQYRKGTYYADVGDFSSAGSARFRLADKLERGVAEISVGEEGYLRGVVVDSVETGNGGSVLFGTEVLRNDGPWTDIREDVRKFNGLLKYSMDIAGGRGGITLLGYDNKWNSPDQIPQRAVAQGLIDELGSLDTTLGGESSRTSLSVDWRGPAFGGDFSASAYAIDSELSLFSNFTYLLDDPDNGDQFQQVDERRLYGFTLSQQWDIGRSRWRAGAEGRFDDIDKVGLFKTNARQPVSTVREDGVEERSLGVFVANEFRFNDQWRSYVGVRHDRYDFDVDALSLPINSGEADDSATSVKASLAWKPSNAMEFYGSYGQGFHSNDARGTTIRIDPVSGDAVDRVDPLVDSEGYELGTRLYFSDRVHATAAVWRLDLDSELLFVGDAGTTEATRPSRRDGVEVGVYWFGNRYFEGDIEASYTRSELTDDDPAGKEIPGSIPLVVSAGLTGKLDNGWFGTLRVRHFGKYPLIEDDSVRSDGSTIVNLRVGKEWANVGLHLDVLNLLDSEDHDIDYFYASRLAGEPEEGVEDIHFHPFEPRA